VTCSTSISSSLHSLSSRYRLRLRIAKTKRRETKHVACFLEDLLTLDNLHLLIWNQKDRLRAASLGTLGKALVRMQWIGLQSRFVRFRVRPLVTMGRVGGLPLTAATVRGCLEIEGNAEGGLD
jgi:hypothetical protein